MFYSRHKYSFSSGTTCLIMLLALQGIHFDYVCCKGPRFQHQAHNVTVKGQRSKGFHTGQEQLFVGHSNDPWGPSSVIDSSLATLQTSQTEHRRQKRGVFDLYNMVFCATGCDPLAFKGYGCYCGFLGSGFTVDGIDRCCKMHDWCYTTANCPMFLEYFIPYMWKCYHRVPLCAIEQHGWGHTGQCARRLCECDRHLAECLRRYPCPTSKAVCTSSPWRLLQNIFML